MFEFIINTWHSHSLVELYAISFICNICVLLPGSYIMYRVYKSNYPVKDLIEFNFKPSLIWSLIPFSSVFIPVLLLIDYIIHELKNT